MNFAKALALVELMSSPLPLGGESPDYTNSLVLIDALGYQRVQVIGQPLSNIDPNLFFSISYNLPLKDSLTSDDVARRLSIQLRHPVLSTVLGWFGQGHTLSAGRLVRLGGCQDE